MLHIVDRLAASNNSLIQSLRKSTLNRNTQQSTKKLVKSLEDLSSQNSYDRSIETYNILEQFL